MEMNQEEEIKLESFECQFCNKVFHRETYLKRHLLVHTGERPYVCNECGKTFGHSHTLKAHMLTHSGDLPYVCDLCGKGFTTSGNRRKHRFCHTNERPYKCSECDKSFNQRTTLKNHMFIHKPIEARPFRCSCGQRYITLGFLNVHRRSCRGPSAYTQRLKTCDNLQGSKEDCYPCTVCDKVFDVRFKLTRHMKFHSVERPYKCELCFKAFGQKSDLKSHIMDHTGERPFPCSLCGAQFKKPSNLKIHMRVHSRGKSKTSKVKPGRPSSHRRKYDVKEIPEFSGPKNEKLEEVSSFNEIDVSHVEILDVDECSTGIEEEYIEDEGTSFGEEESDLLNLDSDETYCSSICSSEVNDDPDQIQGNE